MDIHIPKLQSKTLRRAADAAAYKLYRAAQEWDLVDPILVKDRKDLKSEPKWREHLEPYHHQIKNLITFCRRLPVTLLADDVGLGKTISAGLIASELMSRNRVSKILVVCPKLLIPQWKEELESKFGIPGVMATGKDLVNATIPQGGGAVITTYQSARMHLDALGQSGFEMLVLDEAHKLRNLYGVNQSPQVAQQFRDALAGRMFKYVLMLTATPIQNRLWDIYSLVDLLAVARGHQNPFGSEGVFARTFIADNRMDARQLTPHMRESFRSIVYTYMSRIRRADANLHFPERMSRLRQLWLGKCFRGTSI
jgi:superfamily II DNA or RNA helicase